MKYTRKQIKEAFLKWETDVRLEPDDFLTDEEKSLESVSELAERSTETLLNYLIK